MESVKRRISGRFHAMLNGTLAQSRRMFPLEGLLRLMDLLCECAYAYGTVLSSVYLSFIFFEGQQDKFTAFHRMR